MIRNKINAENPPFYAAGFIRAVSILAAAICDPYLSYSDGLQYWQIYEKYSYSIKFANNSQTEYIKINLLFWSIFMKMMNYTGKGIGVAILDTGE